MLLLSRLRLRLQSLFRREALDDQLSQELAFHLAELKAEFLAKGMTDAQATAAARRAFGSVSSIAEQSRDYRGVSWLEDLIVDTRIACRTFAHAPTFFGIAVLTLALGLGANTALFSTAYAVLFRPLPYPSPELLVTVEKGVAGVGPIVSLRELARSVDYAGYLANNDLNLQLVAESTRARAAVVTANLATVLDVAPARGRWFTSNEERSGQHRVAILSHRLWRDRFHADPAILGRRIVLNEESFEIVGLMPPTFAFPTPTTELWIPIHIDPRDVGLMWGSGNLNAIGRLRPGATLAAAKAELPAVNDRIRSQFPWRMPDAYASGARAVLYAESLAHDIRPKLFALAAATLFLLLIACGNVANLLLARGVQRDREFAMRAALGARRGRLFRQLLAENLVLLSAGGALGLLFAALLLSALPRLLPKDTPRLHELTVDPTLLAITAASMVVTFALFGLAPMLRFWRFRPDSLAGRSFTPSRKSVRLSLALIGVQLGLATLLLVAASLMGRTLYALASVESGVNSTGIFTARFSAGPSRCATPERCLALLDDLSQRLLALPSIRSVNWANYAPLDKEFSATAVDIENHPQAPGAPAFVLWQTSATPGYFPALGIPLRAGRWFTNADRRGAPEVIVISESTAKRFWPNESPLGKRIRPLSNRETRTIIGVVADVAQYSLTGFPDWVDGAQYVPLAQSLPRGVQPIELTAIVESTQPQSVPGALSAILREDRSGVTLSRLQSLDQTRSDSVADQRSTAHLLATFAAIGLLLGVAGVYGVISHRSAQRTREIGIRIALGASAARVITLVVHETLFASAAGCAAGVAAAFALSHLLASLLFGISNHDPVAFVVAPTALLVAALLAAILPGLRASRVDPALTLRHG